MCLNIVASLLRDRAEGAARALSSLFRGFSNHALKSTTTIKSPSDHERLYAKIRQSGRRNVRAFVIEIPCRRHDSPASSLHPCQRSARRAEACGWRPLYHAPRGSGAHCRRGVYARCQLHCGSFPPRCGGRHPLYHRRHP